METKTKNKIGLIALLIVLLVGSFSPVAARSLEGTYVYSALYNQKLDYDGYYYSDIMKYSDLSTQNGIITALFIVEKPNNIVTFGSNFSVWGPYGSNLTVGPSTVIDGTQENGIINATISYQYSNGSTAQETYSQYYDFIVNPVPLDFYVSLGKGDTALVTVYKGALETNITRLQIVKDTSNAVVIKKVFPSLDNIENSLNGIVSSEGVIFGYLVTFVEIVGLAFYILVAPVLVILTLMWGIRKIKESVAK